MTAHSPLLKVAVVGATGSLGGELLDQLRERRFPVQELRPIATDRSLGATIDWLGHELPVATEPETLSGLDLVLVCTPPQAARDWIRRALQAGVACIDFSGAVGDRAEVPLVDADRAPERAVLEAPLLSVPAPAALALARVLRPIGAAAGLARVSATLCDAASGAGRVGVDALQAETIALFNQEERPDTGLDHSLAFDCLPAPGPFDAAGQSALEGRVASELARLLGPELPRAVTALRIPTFAGMGIHVALETERELSPADCLERLGKTTGLASWPGAAGPTTRDAIGQDDVLLGRVRRDPSAPHGLLLWLALDPARLAASNALRIAEARFRGA